MRLDAYEVSLKTRFVLERLTEHGITHTIDGTPISDLGYEDLKRELAIQRCKNMDTDHAENAWF